MKCERFDKLIHLFLDGRLEKDEGSELQDHLSTCEECARKLALLKSTEGAAKKIEVEEPQQEYWDTFSSRVREKITQREEKSLAFGLKEALRGLFSFSPLRIKVAAGLASVLLVFIVGRLYVDYRGQEMIPSRTIVRTEEQPNLDVTKMEEKGKVSEAEDRDGTARPPHEPKREQKVVDIEEAKKKAPPSGEPISAEEMAAEELGTLTAPEVAAKRKTSVGIPVPTVETQAEPEAPSKRMTDESEATGAAMKGRDVEEAPVETPSPEVEVKEERGTGGKAEQKPKKSELKEILSVQVGFVGRDRFLLDQNMVPNMGEYDTLRQADELTRAIQIWKDYIDENPADSLTNQGYLQVATAYYLLAKLSQDTTVISEGTELIEGYLDQIEEPALEEKLSDILGKIGALKEK